MRKLRDSAWYDGKNSLIREKDYCMNCKDFEKEAKLICSKCNFFVYCSKSCHHIHGYEHHSICNKLVKFKKDIQLLEQNADVVIAIHSASERRIQDKNFCRIINPYVRAKSQLAVTMYSVAMKFYMNRLWKKGNDIMEENISLAGERGAPSRMCYDYVQGLMNQGRIDDAISFCTEKMIFMHQRENIIAISFSAITYADLLRCIDENGGDMYIIYLFLCYLIKVISFSRTRQVLDTFHRTFFGKNLADRLCDGPQSLVLSYLIPLSRDHQSMSWVNFIMTCETSRDVTLMLTRVLHVKEKAFMNDLELFTRNNIVRFGSQQRIFLDDKSEFIFEKLGYCISNIPDLSIWLQYFYNHS